MPLFGNKFAPRSIPVRRRDTAVVRAELGAERAARDLALELPPLALRLHHFEIAFDDGHWIPASGAAGAAHQESLRLRGELQRLEEENNMLRLKFEVLLDMVAERTVADHQPDTDTGLQRAHSAGSLRQRGKKRS